MAVIHQVCVVSLSNPVFQLLTRFAINIQTVKGPMPPDVCDVFYLINNI